MRLIDRYGRTATDLRVSLIDKCNLRCSYCMPADGMPWIPKQLLMTAGEIVRIVDVGRRLLGVEELRLTGGEPLVRKDLEDIVAGVRAQHPDLPISMTTNAIGLDRRAHALKDAGVDRINVSLDSLHRETFAALTRRDSLEAVLAGVRAAEAAGLGPIKINAVLLRDVNYGEIADLARWAMSHEYELRFIEHMPLDGDRAWTHDRVVSAAEIRKRLQETWDLRVDPRERAGAPAERFELRVPGAGPNESPLGRVGIIPSVTEPFCAACTRTRVTAEGRVRSCLFSHEETDLLAVLRNGGSDDDIAATWAEAMWRKPRAHGKDRAGFERGEFVQPERSMSAIGG